MHSPRNGASGPKKQAAKPSGPRSPDDRVDLLTPREAAKMFGVTVSTLALWARNGALPSVPTPGGHRRYRRDHVQKLLDDRQPQTDPVRMEMEEDVVRLYNAGWSIRQVARRFGRSYGAIHRILARHTALRERRQRP